VEKSKKKKKNSLSLLSFFSLLTLPRGPDRDPARLELPHVRAPQVHGGELLGRQQRERGLLVRGRVAIGLLLLLRGFFSLSPKVEVEVAEVESGEGDADECRGEEEDSQHHRWLSGGFHAQSVTGTFASFDSRCDKTNRERRGRTGSAARGRKRKTKKSKRSEILKQRQVLKGKKKKKKEKKKGRLSLFLFRSLGGAFRSPLCFCGAPPPFSPPPN